MPIQLKQIVTAFSSIAGTSPAFMPATIRSEKKTTSRKGLILFSSVFTATPEIPAVLHSQNLSLLSLCQDVYDAALFSTPVNKTPI